MDDIRIRDRVEIEQCIYRYARAVDRLDYDSIVTCYHDDAIDVHGAYRGTVQGLVDDIRRRHQTVDSSQHYISNVLIEFRDDNSADVESYCLCFIRNATVDADGTQRLMRVRCRYVDRFERRDGTWRIAARTVVFDERARTSVVDELDPTWVVSRRDRSDAVYATLTSPQ